VGAAGRSAISTLNDVAELRARATARLGQTRHDPILILESLDLRGATVVPQDWGGPIGLYWATRHPERVAGLFILQGCAAMARVDDWTFEGTWPYEPRWFDAPDGRLHYVDEGPRDGRPVVLVHGNPTWGYLCA
jgi:pimeloyl-ACP methyl ester carboxylesterase